VDRDLRRPVDDLYGAAFAAGALLGDWVVDRLVAEGGFAALYRCRHATTGEPAAVKVLHQALAQSDKMLIRFRREVEALSRLRHSGIARVLGSGELTDGRPFIALDWLDGADLLGELERRGPLRAHDALAVIEAIGDALHAAHQVGVVHRDVKAQNVMAVPDGAWFRPVLVDFGIAKLAEPVDGARSLTTRTQLGTPHTAAPEQILGQPVDARTDIYALGLLLYQLVTGRVPFDAPSAVEVEEMHLHRPPPAASEIAPVPKALDRVIARAMAKQVDRRPDDVPEFLAAARAALRGAATVDRRDGVALWLRTDPGTDEDVLVAADELLALAEQLAVDAGLRVVVDTPDELLMAAVGVDRAVVDRIAETVRGRAGRVGLTAEIREAQVEVCAGELVGGELVTPALWRQGA
jgi:serine/threonine-protein kinase